MTRKLFAAVFFACLTASVALAQSTSAQQQPNAPAARFRSQVESIAAGADTAARGAAITKRLDELGVKYQLVKFTQGTREGTNIVAELAAPAGAKRRLTLGAHYDRVAAGQGAVDNASGCAAVLELLAALKAKPLKSHSVAAVFFDLEEVGLVGSKAFVAADAGKNVPDVFVNFDVFGYGDALYVMSPKDDAPAARAFRQAASEAKHPLTLGPRYPPSDHLSFLGTRAEAVSVSIVGAEEIELIGQLLGGTRPEKMPRALATIHTPQDTPDKIDGAAAERALSVVERALRLLDAPQP